MLLCILANQEKLLNIELMYKQKESKKIEAVFSYFLLEQTFKNIIKFKFMQITYIFNKILSIIILAIQIHYI